MTVSGNLGSRGGCDVAGQERRVGGGGWRNNGNMELLEKLRSGLTTSMRARDTVRVSAIRLVLAEAQTRAVAGKTSRDLEDGEVVEVVKSVVKKCNEAAEIYEGAGSLEKAELERSQAAVLTAYLPRQLSDNELEELVTQTLAESGTVNVGQAIKLVRIAAGDRADGGRIAAVVKAKLD